MNVGVEYSRRDILIHRGLLRVWGRLRTFSFLITAAMVNAEIRPSNLTGNARHNRPPTLSSLIAYTCNVLEGYLARNTRYSLSLLPWSPANTTEEEEITRETRLSLALSRNRECKGTFLITTLDVVSR